MSDAPGLVLSRASKRFGGERALEDVTFVAYPGEVHALIGENGSGKSTLVKIVSGVYAPEPGTELTVWGTQVALPFASPHRHGIAVIHQDLGLVEGMTVFENLGVTSSYGSRLLSPINRRKERERYRELLAGVGLSVPLDAPVRTLSPAVRAGIAIARAKRLLEDHREEFIFILDEPTAYLGREEADEVMTLMRNVAKRSSVVIFVSHRLQEVLSVSDRITVLRDGRVADTFEREHASADRIITSMLGRPLERFYPERPAPPRQEAVLSVSGLSGAVVSDLSLDVDAGEVVGLAGLVGMGHEEVPYLIAGAARARSGTVRVNGEDTMPMPVEQRIRRGVVLVPGNRQRDGVRLEATAQENIGLLRTRRRGMLSPIGLPEERRDTGRLMAQLRVHPPVPGQRLSSFSGGNQQKVVLAKWLARRPSVLLLDEPTQGIDAGAKLDVLEIIRGVAEEGAAVLISSGDYEQLAQTCHRVLVFRYGAPAAELEGDELSEQRIAMAAQGSVELSLTTDTDSTEGPTR